MATCQEIFDFLNQLNNRTVTNKLSDADLMDLKQIGLVQYLTPDEYGQLSQAVAGLSSAANPLGNERAQRAQVADTVATEVKKTHSILFRLEGKEKQAVEEQKEAQAASTLRALDADIGQRDRDFSQLVAKKSLLDTLFSYDGGYVALTGFGRVQLRDLGLRLYRFSDKDFATYWKVSQAVESELEGVGIRSAQFFAALWPNLSMSDRSYLWAIAIGLAKRVDDVGSGAPAFLEAYSALGSLTRNDQNRLMSAEIISALGRPVAESIPLLADLQSAVRASGVPTDSSLGVASILFFGRRQDGSFATPNLSGFLRLTRSYESAALLSILNLPFDQLAGKFGTWRSVFASWGFQPSEDVELASAYLAVSELPAEGVGTKLGILTRGLNTYLQYPLVASAILASIPVLEANETLNLLERAYGIIGTRAMPLSQAELICLAVRMVHGLKSETISDLDATATAPAPTPGAPYPYVPHPMFFFLPLIVSHGFYYSTFSGVGGAHPGHVHSFGGFTG